MLKSVFSEIRVKKKNRPLIGSPNSRSAIQRPVFLAGNRLNSCPDSGLKKTDFSKVICIPSFRAVLSTTIALL